MTVRATPEIMYLGSYTVVRVNLTSGAMAVVAGLSGAPYRGYADGVGGAAMFNSLFGRGLDAVGGAFLYLGDSGSAFTGVRRIDLGTGAVTSPAGGPTAGFQDGVGSQAQFSSVTDVLLSQDQTLAYITDSTNSRVRVLTLATNNVTTLVGNGVAANVDGVGTGASLLVPGQLGQSADGRYLFVMCGNRHLRVVYLPTLQLRTLASFPNAQFFNFAPSLLSNNVLYVATLYRIYTITPFSYTGILMTLAGNGTNTDANGPVAGGATAFSQIMFIHVVNETYPAAANGNFVCAACASCPVGFTSVCNASFSGCRPCTVCAVGTATLVACNTSTDAVCGSCPIATFCAPGQGSAPCPPGSFCPSAGLTAPVPCAPGAFSSAAGLTACTPTPPGTFSANSGASAPTLCPPGSFGTAAGGTSCAPCAPGSFTASAGRTACSPSPAGAFVPTTGASAPTPCPVDTYLASTGSSGPACTPCALGLRCTNTSLAPTPCPALPSPQARYDPGRTSGAVCPIYCDSGYYLPLCAACPPDFYCANSTRYACPAGTTSMGVTAGSSFLDCVCLPGTYGSVLGPATAQCQACPANAFCPSDTERSACACAAGR